MTVPPNISTYPWYTGFATPGGMPCTTGPAPGTPPNVGYPWFDGGGHPGGCPWGTPVAFGIASITPNRYDWWNGVPGTSLVAFQGTFPNIAWWELHGVTASNAYDQYLVYGDGPPPNPLPLDNTSAFPGRSDAYTLRLDYALVGATGTVIHVPSTVVMTTFDSALATGATAGTPGTWTPAGKNSPGHLWELQNGGVTASPTSKWTTGQYVSLADGSKAYWSGTAWVGGTAP